jgi:LacI family transcriptional regulator, repressor for deo operon, udp, cdd, tsx, nupC, and nupG
MTDNDPIDPDASQQSRRARARIEDVATLAGVSVATVSRALRDLPNVADSTRHRVQEAATALEYRADPAASRLATGRSRSVAVVVQLLNGWYSSHVVAGVEAVCAESGYDTIVIGVGPGSRDRDVFAGSAAIHRRVDAIIFVDVRISPAELQALAEHSLSVVSVGHELPEIASVGIDDVEVGRIATRHLIDLGHRRIGLIHGPAELPLVVPSRRQTGFEDTMRAAGLEPDPELYIAGNFTIQDGADALNTLMDRSDPPTAIFALADEMAFGVMLAAEERGIRIPEDLSLIGVDDHDVAPVLGLTTVHQDVAEHGARAARLVVAQLDRGIEPKDPDPAPIRLIIRRTTAELLTG